MRDSFLHRLGYEEITKIGSCLRNGELVVSPFEDPLEEQRMWDPDLGDDDLNFALDNLCVSLEPELREGRNIEVKRLEKSSLVYFLDGSLRTKYVGEYSEGRLSCPLIVSEIGVTVVKRELRNVRPLTLKKRQYFIFPHKDSGLLSDTTYDRLHNLGEELERNSSRTRVEFLQKTDIKGDVKYSMLGKVRSIMHDFEHDVGSSLERLSTEWLVMDGAIRKHEFMQLPNTIGLAKSFSRKPVLDVGRGKPIMLPLYLRGVKEGQRSAVFRKQQETTEQLVFWYVRLRSLPQIEPLEGVVKIDYNLRKDNLEREDIDRIDEISAEIYSLRNPAIYPHRKWLSTIYPIKFAEECLSSSFTSKEILGRIGGWLRHATRS